MSDAPNSKQAEKDYLRRSGSLEWERTKPFSPAGSQTLHDSLPLMHDFAVAVTALDLSPGHRVLDLGVGSCWTTEWLARLNVDVVGTDIALDMLRVGRARVEGGDARLVTADLETLPFASASFDRALCMNALHHIPDPALALREIARVLTPTGRLVLVEPGAGHADRESSLTATQHYGVLEQELEATHLMRLCEDAGFPRVVVRPISYMTSEVELDRDELTRWRMYLRKNRPMRALHKLRYLLYEFAGARKRQDLFEDMLSILLARVIGRHVFEQSLIVAHKSAEITSRKAYAAEIQITHVERTSQSLTITVRCRNTGTSTWRAAGAHPVRLGVQVLDGSKTALVRDYQRVPLDANVPADGEWISTFEVTRPADPAAAVVRLDLVAEGVTWFETNSGSSVCAL